MGTIASVHNFFNAPKRQNILRKSINTISQQQKFVSRTTRWIDRHGSVSTFPNLQFTVVEALAEISAWPGKETSSRALQLLSTITQSEFCIALLVLKYVFGYSVVLCKVKQKRSINLLEAVNIAQDIANELKCLREKTEYVFHQLYIFAQETAKAEDFILKIPRQ